MAELRAIPRFATLWNDHRLRAGHATPKRFRHPEVGELTLDCDDLIIAGTDLELIVLSPAPGSSSPQSLALLATIGGQRFDAAASGWADTG